MTERRDLPLLAFGDARHDRQIRRRKMAGRIVALGVGVALVGVTIVAPPAPRLVWNRSASAPLGLYAITYRSTIRQNSTVLARPPVTVRRFAAIRRYLPLNVPLVKRVAAVPGDEICARGAAIFVNGREIVRRQMRDARGRSLPWWNGCHRLRDGQFLLLNSPAGSFDGRYFGVSERADIIGKAHRL